MVVAVLKDGPVIWVFYDGGMITFGMTEIETRMEISEACMTPAEVWWSSASAVYRLVKGTGEWNEITNDRCEVIALLYDGTAMIRVLENGTVVWFSSSGDHTTKVLPDQSIVAATLLSVNGESTLITVE
ncbi:MAG: hypothetical protein KVP17_002669 [Porospora cf. gigantea B]|uniref:uncharacterized protein n=1 Tax=Porospora cf. gigantea B TaxID=2853592 RepID=UPI0035717B2F|nr:MAG: hypothetical protein KVP17_002669 [Porospora cf. gigantea B]